MEQSKIQWVPNKDLLFKIFNLINNLTTPNTQLQKQIYTVLIFHINRK